MTRITNKLIRNHFQSDYVEQIGGGWKAIQETVLRTRNILANPTKFPRADFDYLEKLDLEGTCFLLSAPVQFIV